MSVFYYSQGSTLLGSVHRQKVPTSVGGAGGPGKELSWGVDVIEGISVWLLPEIYSPPIV